MSDRRRRLALSIAGALAGIALALPLLGSSGSPAGRAVVVARTALPAGMSIDAARASERLELRRVSSASPLAGMLTSVDAAIGRRTRGPIAVGEPVTLGVLGGSDEPGDSLRADERIVPVPAATAGGGAALVPGDHVDVVAARGEGANGRVALVVADAIVFDVTGTADGAPDGGSVLLRVSSRAALEIAGALNFSRDVRLVRRQTPGA